MKVLDFGLAKATEDATPAGNPEDSPTMTLEQATRTGAIMGTAAYMAPEQARGKAGRQARRYLGLRRGAL